MPSGVYKHTKHIKDLTGQKFGYLTVIGIHHSDNGIYWECHCDCGGKTVTKGCNLKSGHTRSCGCYNKKIVKEQNEARKLTPRTEENNDHLKVYFNNSDEYFICDLEDKEVALSESWYKGKNGYPACNRTNIPFHKYVTDSIEGMVVDHINRNKMDNRRCNLRIVTQSVNMQNTNRIPKSSTGVLGVHFDKRKQKYYARIKIDNKNHYKGNFKNIEDAIAARKELEEKYNYGGF